MTRVLIGYATRGGAARDISLIVGDTLAAWGWRVRVADLRDVPELGRADVVVLGSGIQAGLWYPEATAWIAAHGTELDGLTVAVFNACLNAAKPGKHAEALAYNAAAQKRTGAIMSQAFAGRFAPEKTGFFRRVFLRAIQQEPRDYIDPAAIRSWAEALAVADPR